LEARGFVNPEILRLPTCDAAVVAYKA